MVVYGTRSLERKEQAYELLRLGAAEFWGMEELPPLERGERGKPWMPQLPNRHFNLSHSGTLALCALSAQPVGVDIQVVRVWRDSLLERSCTTRERAWLRERGDRPEDFAQLWALKESMGKQNGYGLPYPPSRLETPLPPSGEPFRPGEVYTVGPLYLSVYQGEGWQGAVCAMETPPAEIRWVDGL